MIMATKSTIRITHVFTIERAFPRSSRPTLPYLPAHVLSPKRARIIKIPADTCTLAYTCSDIPLFLHGPLGPLPEKKNPTQKLIPRALHTTAIDVHKNSREHENCPDLSQVYLVQVGSILYLFSRLGYWRRRLCWGCKICCRCTIFCWGLATRRIQ